MQPSGIYQRDSNMKILFGSYSQIFPALGVSSDILKVVREGQQQYYALAVEMIARGYVNAGATMPTVNAFFLRRALHENLSDVYQEMLARKREMIPPRRKNEYLVGVNDPNFYEI
jgi:hypothetical protein